MGDEIKIQYADVEQVLSKVNASSNAFQTTLPTSIGKHNILNLVRVINRIKQSLQQVNESYKSLLLSNKEATDHAIQSMRKIDDQLSSTIKALK
ncbi:YwqI/YxiC family protein [Cytobacillus sp. Hz8]|uniref:YwqI/YxiC family protein n=1 Tax=Cytobacillus sp. Hz8 TaxID=3347168 RepID=UPI0035D82A35